jgi:uncharacterized SAM-binding protein YcdF (DUF218 family)
MAAEAAQTPPEKRRIARAIAALAALLAALYAAGFFIFAAALDRLPPADVPVADAIVVLTGGRDRITEAYRLLEDGKGKRLLITGVHPEVKRGSLKHMLRGVPTSRFDCCVDIGRQAEDTIGNANETAEWVARHGYRSILLVTSNYHMPRAALELRRAMPGVSITSYPVAQDTLHLDGWWNHPGTAKLLLAEYSKYLLTLAHARMLIRA